MCTVTYLPSGDNGYILTSNRDESIKRKPSLTPSKYLVHDSVVFFPKDTEANGTWIATSPNSYTLCLLNGGFEKHAPSPPYKTSRGLMLLDFFKYKNVNTFCKDYDFNGIEPFTLIIVCCIADLFLYELRWDGSQLYVNTKRTDQPHIWSSTTLYNKETINNRERWFADWLKKSEYYTPEDVLFFHHFGGNGDLENDLVMDRTEKKTVSITSIVHEKDTRTILYEDILNKNVKRFRLY